MVGLAHLSSLAARDPRPLPPCLTLTPAVHLALALALALTLTQTLALTPALAPALTPALPRPLPAYEAQLSQLLAYYRGAPSRRLHGYERFRSEGPVSSTPNTKSLQLVLDFKWREFGLLTFMRNFVLFFTHLVISTWYNMAVGESIGRSLSELLYGLLPRFLLNGRGLS